MAKDTQPKIKPTEAMNKVVQADKQVTLSPGFKLKANRPLYATGHGSYTTCPGGKGSITECTVG